MQYSGGYSFGKKALGELTLSLNVLCYQDSNNNSNFYRVQVLSRHQLCNNRHGGLDVNFSSPQVSY